VRISYSWDYYGKFKWFSEVIGFSNLFGSENYVGFQSRDIKILDDISVEMKVKIT
jgi:hypothetical protein